MTWQLFACSVKVNDDKSVYFREFDLMFLEADRNNDGKIDFDEFVAMMLPATMMSPESQINAGPA